MVLFGVILNDFVCITSILLQLETVAIKPGLILLKSMTNTYLNGLKQSHRETEGNIFSTSCISIAFPLEIFLV